MAKQALRQTQWVSSAQTIAGRDHLAVQAVSEHLYADLLPGITNVTDRARCYSFYPWFVWAFDQRSKKKNTEEVIRIFRRAECLHTIIGINHELEAKKELPHGGGLVGRDTLVAVAKKVFDGGTIQLSHFSSLDAESSDRYFKNKFGGLGQYYLGPLKDLEVLDGDARTGIKYTKEWGATLAKLYNSTVETSKFFDAVRDDDIDRTIVQSLRSFCPCNLRNNGEERDALIDLFLCRGRGELKHAGGAERRRTLLLILDYARRTRATTRRFADPQGFLFGAYTRFLADDKPWIVDSHLEKTVEGWAIYQRHELLAIAAQGVFWAGLTALGLDAGYVRDTAAYAKWFANYFQPSLSTYFNSRFDAIISQHQLIQPSLSEWQSANHELSVANRLLEAQRHHDPQAVVSLSAQILTSLIARGCVEQPYGQFELADRFLDTYEINLAALQRRATTTWSQMDGRQWVEWIAANWSLRVHLRVALRKLRYQTQDTFRVVPLEDGLYVREAPAAKWSSPRLAQAFRFLHDLGALDESVDGAGAYLLTGFGEELLEAELDRA